MDLAVTRISPSLFTFSFPMSSALLYHPSECWRIFSYLLFVTLCSLIPSLTSGGQISLLFCIRRQPDPHPRLSIIHGRCGVPRGGPSSH
ncbi:hypothetical protein IW261DRAFT_1473605 [Armillaria novae-zelandiae]|uniref:Uncharacterized protein n=1 Tax=Armillaria novae-zelandiae TaxID=153914 RepID=A0AA39PAJ2_9AGAR|nr:hypothetical protein IW261DRAFT_1473605 [Armillaria novae-zelandiae]